MRETLTTLELRRRLGEVLDRIALRHDEFLVSRKGKPMAAMVPVEKLEKLQRAARSYLSESLDRRPPTGTPQREADSLADEAKHATRGRSRDRSSD